MNRRECLSSATGALATLGLPTTVETIDKDPVPLLLVVTVHKPNVSQHDARHLRESLEQAFKGLPHPPIVVCSNNTSIKAVLDPRASK